MDEQSSTKKQEYLNKLNEWREKYSNCMMSSEEIDALFVRDKEDFATDDSNIFEEE